VTEGRNNLSTLKTTMNSTHVRQKVP